MRGCEVCADPNLSPNPNPTLTLILNPGVVFVTAYVGHEGGSREYEALLEYLRELDPREWNVVVHDVRRPTHD